MVIPNSDHTTTSASKAMVPKNLRVRMVMADMWGSWRVARGKGRTIRGAPIQSSAPSGQAKRLYDRFRTADFIFFGRQMVVDRGRRADRGHGAGRRRHAADG